MRVTISRGENSESYLINEEAWERAVFIARAAIKVQVELYPSQLNIGAHDVMARLAGEAGL